MRTKRKIRREVRTRRYVRRNVGKEVWTRKNIRREVSARRKAGREVWRKRNVRIEVRTRRLAMRGFGIHTDTERYLERSTGRETCGEKSREKYGQEKCSEIECDSRWDEHLQI
jgi:hypothetical protein